MPSPEPARLYRVSPHRTDARAGEPGHPLYLPRVQGAGRVDNPEHYRILYAADDPAGAVAEAFGNHAVWTDALFAGPPALAGSLRALVTYDAPALRVLDLDDARALLTRRLRPSGVVTRDRAVTQAWALAVWRERRWAGIRWWSYWDPRWGALGLWNTARLRVAAVEPLGWEHRAVAEAQAVLLRPRG